jgi:O-antigen ligase
MILIAFFQLAIVGGLVRASRRRLEDALPLFCFFLVLMPLESRFVIPGLFDVNTMRISLATLLILYLVKGKNSGREPLPLRRAMLLHVGWAICSTLYSLSVATSMKQLLTQVLEFYTMYFLLVKTISRVETVYKIIYAMMLAMGVCCFFALLEAYASWSILSIFPPSTWITYDSGQNPLYIEVGRGLRVRSTFPHPILFGDALAMSIPLNFYLLSIWKRRRQRLILWPILALMFWAIYKTQSRGPWIATAMCSVLLFIMVRKSVRRYLISIALVALFVLLVRPGVWHSIDALYEASTDPNQPVGSSYLYRHALTDAITNSVESEPGRALLGYGLGTFRVLGLKIYFLGESRIWYTCDDNWDLFLYETGYVGLVLIAMLLLKPLLIALRSYRTLTRPENELSGVLFISLIGFYFLMLSVASYCWGQQGYMSWILIALVVSHPRVMRIKEESETAERIPEPHELNEKKEIYFVS